jgi:hypothetical protein
MQFNPNFTNIAHKTLIQEYNMSRRKVAHIRLSNSVTQKQPNTYCHA